jgi:hypothetical protein
MRIPLPVLLCLLAFPAFGAKPLNPLAIHYPYGDGDFPAVILAIEEFTKANKTLVQHDERSPVGIEDEYASGIRNWFLELHPEWYLD